MPIYTVELDGKQYDIEGDRPPSEEEARAALQEFSNIGSNKKPEKSIMNNGLDYVKQHPFKTAFQGAAQTITGKSAQDYALEATAPTENDIRPNDPLSYNMAFAKNALAGMAGSAFDMATSPANYVLGPLLKAAGMGVAKSIDAGRAINSAIKNAQKEFGAIRVEDLGRKIEERISNVRIASDNKLSSMNNALDIESNQKLPVFREALKKYFSENSARYGNILDNISDNLASKGESITRGELKQILDDVAKESQEQFIDFGKPMDELMALRRKYELDSPKTIKSIILDKNGKPMQSIEMQTKNLDDELNFKEVINDIKSVKNALSSKVKMGYRYSPEDVVAAKLMGKWGDYVESKIPEFRQLNQEYKPIIQAMNLASKEFKPYASDFDIKGAKFLKDFALQKNTGQVDRDKLLTFIENGTKNFPGVGNFTSKLRNVGNAYNAEKQSIDMNISDLTRRKAEIQDLLSKQQSRKAKIKKAAAIGSAALGLEETFGPGYVRKNILGR